MEQVLEAINNNILALQTQLNRINLTLRQNNINPEETVQIFQYAQPETVEQLNQFLSKDVKNLPAFSGEGQPPLNEWLLDVSPIMANLNRLLVDSPDYHYYLREIRRKIIGKAGNALTNYGVPLHWPSMLEALKRQFSDKRSLTILEMQATTLRQGKDTMEVYFNRTNKLLTKIVEAIKLSPEIGPEHSFSHMKQARTKVLAYFVNGLHERYESSCRAMKPKNLDEAFNMCLEIRNSLHMKQLMRASEQPSSSKNPQFQKKNFNRNVVSNRNQELLELLFKNMYQQIHP
jgi:hypothetical protein